MGMYILPLIWIVGAVICYIIAKRKNIQLTALWNITFVILGPIAIPFIIIAKRNGDTN